MVREDFLSTRGNDESGYFPQVNDPEIDINDNDNDNYKVKFKEFENNENINHSGYIHVEQGCLWKVFAALAIYYTISIVISIGISIFTSEYPDLSDWWKIILFFLLAKGFKTLTIKDTDTGLNMEWGPWNLCKYCCGCCQSLSHQKLHLYYEDIEYYTIDENPRFTRYCYGIRDTPQICCCRDKLYSYNNAICCCKSNIKNYVAFQFKLRDNYTTQHPCRSCCREKTHMAVVTNDKLGLHSMLLNRGLIYDNEMTDLVAGKTNIQISSIDNDENVTSVEI